MRPDLVESGGWWLSARLRVAFEGRAGPTGDHYNPGLGIKTEAAVLHCRRTPRFQETYRLDTWGPTANPHITLQM